MQKMIRNIILISIFSLQLSITNAATKAFNVRSNAFVDGAMLPMKHVFNSFGCTGKNVSPDLQWANAPAGTQSFAVTVYDPDAPTGSGWWHWTVFNIPANITSLKEGMAMASIGAGEGRTDFGSAGYGGPCPPPGKPHRYIFKVFAIKVPKLALDKEASGAMVGYTLNANSLATTAITAKFGRDK